MSETKSKPRKRNGKRKQKLMDGAQQAFKAREGKQIEPLLEEFKESIRDKNSGIRKALRYENRVYLRPQLASAKEAKLELIALAKLNKNNAMQKYGFAADSSGLHTLWETLKNSSGVQLSYVNFLDLCIMDDFWGSFKNILRKTGSYALGLVGDQVSGMLPAAKPLVNQGVQWLRNLMGDNLPQTDPPAEPAGAGQLNSMFADSAPLNDCYNTRAINKLAIAS